MGALAGGTEAGGAEVVVKKGRGGPSLRVWQGWAPAVSAQLGPRIDKGPVGNSMMRQRTVKGLIFLFLLGSASPLWAQSNPVQYVYDALGRLTTVVDPSGNVATYNYDAVGNLLSITRTTRRKTTRSTAKASARVSNVTTPISRKKI